MGQDRILWDGSKAMIAEPPGKGSPYHGTSAQINPFLCNLWVKTSIVVEFHSSVFIGSSSNGGEQWVRLRKAVIAAAGSISARDALYC